MAYFVHKAILAAFGLWGLFAVSGANVNWWQIDPPRKTAQQVRAEAAPAPQPLRLPVAQPTPMTTTTITTIANCADVQALAVSLGWPPDELQTLMSVVKAESECYPWAHNLGDPNGGSYGLLQINGFWCLPSRYYPMGYLQELGVLSTCDDLFNATVNLRAGLAVLAQSGWHAWATFDG
jgi:hypothetical protein